MAFLDDSLNLLHTSEYADFVPSDLRQVGTGAIGFGTHSPAAAASEAKPPSAGKARQSAMAGKADGEMCSTQAKLNKDSIHIDMEIKFPKKEKKKKIVEKKSMGSLLSGIFAEQKFPEPVYFQNVDCVGLPNFLTPKECRQICEFAEAQGFTTQHRARVLNIAWADLVDPFFAESIWSLCGLGWFLRTITIDGMVPCGLNDVIRIQKYTQGGLFGRHVDQNVRRADGKVSKYSLRIFLNGSEDEFEGGLSVFHVPFREDPVVFEPETGLALLYPQGDMCTVQEETEVLFGYKYVLRADVLFCKKEHLQNA